MLKNDVLYIGAEFTSSFQSCILADFHINDLKPLSHIEQDIRAYLKLYD